MPHQGQRLSGLDEQIEAGENRFVIRVTEVDIIEMNVPLQRRHIPFIDLDDIRIGVDQSKSAFGSRKPCLDLRPKCGKVEHREEELVETHDEEVPCTDGNNSLCRAQAAHIDQDSREDAAQSIERREDERKHKTALHIDLIRLLVRFIEGIEDALLLAKVFRYGNTADC